MSAVPFIVTIDTEGDNQWARPREITTRNADYLPRFQELCERFGFKPVYLTNYEMATSAAFGELADHVVATGRGEIGMHLHAWNSPPLVPLTHDDFVTHPYLAEYSREVMREKITTLTGILEQRFGCKMVSHRAGRWLMDGRYAELLLEAGYRVDCSVTPGLDWGANSGAHRAGPDYRRFPRRPYFMSAEDLARPAAAGLLQVPMTVVPSRAYEMAPWLYATPLVRRALNRLSPGRPWLCPVQTTLRVNLDRHLRAMLDVARAVRTDPNATHLEFMVHSSELMPGGSPNFRTRDDIELLYAYLEELFEEVAQWCYGATLAEYGAQQSRAAAVRAAGASNTVPVGASWASG